MEERTNLRLFPWWITWGFKKWWS